MMSNKVKYGFKNVYYAPITLTNNVPSYAPRCIFRVR